MIDDIYNSKLLEYAGNIGRTDRLGEPDASAKAHSKLCGSTVIIDLKMDGERVSDYGQEVKACALGQAASSIMAANIVGASADELRTVREEMIAMLKADGPAPTGRFADLKYLMPVKDYKARHASTLLVFDAVVDALDQIAEDRASAA
ncbi:iron-sulfur cluster assembly scaffold protein [Oricola sp.]|uniref:iron-sulfur cluster assembly scaffold protein n=1 Tax=Oricola sp. TaxID=1979950 RepID=UPI003BA91B44